MLIGVAALVTGVLLVLQPHPSPPGHPPRLTVSAAASRFGTSHDTRQINAAIAFVAARGGGTVLVPKGAQPWRVIRSDPSDQKAGGVLITTSGVTLRSNGAVLQMADNCDFITVRSAMGTYTSVVQPVRTGERTMHVADATRFVVGQWVFVRAGRAAYDAAEPAAWFHARIIAKRGTDALVLSDKIPPELASEDVIEAAPVRDYVHDVKIVGSWRLANDTRGGANAESGISIVNAQHVSVGDITALNPGAGAVSAQYVDDLRVDSIRVLGSVRQNGQDSKGRGFGFGESSDVVVDSADIDDFEGNAVIVEAGCRRVRVGDLVLRNDFSGREFALPAVAALGDSRLEVETLRVRGADTYLFDTGGTKGNSLVVGTLLSERQSQITLAELATVRDRLQIGSMVFTRQTTEQTVAVSPEAPASRPLPAGFPVSLRLVPGYAAALRVVLQDRRGSASVDHIATSSAPISEQYGFGRGYDYSTSTGKTLTISSDRPIAAEVTYDFFRQSG